MTQPYRFQFNVVVTDTMTGKSDISSFYGFNDSSKLVSPVDGVPNLDAIAEVIAAKANEALPVMK